MELPLEIITNILTRLPVKPLTRFKCVSKPWNSLISSPSFINHHFKLNPNTTIILTLHETNHYFEPNPNNTVIVTHYNFLFSALIQDNTNNNLHFSELEYVNLKDSCNGILLISDSDIKTMYLCNPANNTYRLLPPVHTPPLGFFRFSYDSHIDDYKVIGIFQCIFVSMEIFIYSLRDNVWKIIKLESASALEYFLLEPCSFGANGGLYFAAITEKRKLVIRCFDVRTGLFSTVDCPDLDCYDSQKVSMSFRMLDGCICLLVSYLTESDQMYGVRNGLLLYADAWEMREDGKKVSWVKLFRIQESEIVKPCRYLSLVVYLKDKGKVLLEVNRDWFGWYDLVTKRVMKVTTHGFQGKSLDRQSMKLFTYGESLVSVSNKPCV